MSGIIAVIFIGYGVGNFATSYILGELFKKTDIRKHGSGNAGATNALRVFGVKLAAATFVIDALKGVLAVIIGRLILGDVGGLIGGISVVVGHNWPILLKFKGGKGIASTIGVVTTINYQIALICIIVGLVIVIKTRYVSLGSITAISLLPILIVVMVRPFDLYFFIFSLLLVAMAIFRHRSNIKRLINGNESKLGKKAI
ncbi:glycerol-3-phosphate 1-O-acyltransferase PlsY [Proteiniborus sp. MB09-C3]|uniref:glycerol-3-phosphate 1-O-acyltransferase PlsY n=1 Tax=Proteiniborus sp. MB09-C3 TaxID=3050072 RepID=UPI0025563B78|nr:glycerol-3-phosphate 1-O-acyltransferase PlsY [Proteiniborus sp. MB09-C3]WIV10780.1 glycerol-3-phosphate 1-O-acyltransferase PlsY [Proteiniborus sp. MB09-C3]